MIEGDVIVSVDGVPVRDKNHLMQVIGETSAGTKVDLQVHRIDESLRSIIVTLGMRPEQLDAR